MDGDYRVAKKVSLKEARRTELHVWPDCSLEVVDEQVDERVACRSSFDVCPRFVEVVAVLPGAVLALGRPFSQPVRVPCMRTRSMQPY
jgi:hypothetical protein